jgi:hypothetical protein
MNYLLYYKKRVCGPFTQEQLDALNMEAFKQFTENNLNIMPITENFIKDPNWTEDEVYIVEMREG